MSDKKRLISDLKRMIRKNYYAEDIASLMCTLREYDEENFESYREDLLELARDVNEYGEHAGELNDVIDAIQNA
jgi:hypothetical protein